MSALRVNSGTGNGKSPRRTFHFRVGSGRRTGSSGRFGNGGLEGRGFLDGSCSRPDMRLLSERNATSANDQDFTSGYCQKAIGHIVSVGLNTRHRRLSQRSTRLPKRFMIGAEGLEPSRAGCRAGPWPSCDDGIVPLICPTCQNVFAGIAQSIHASDRQATLHGVVFDILVGSESRVGPCGCLSR